MVEKDATQCGFCSPGIVVSMAALLRANPTPTAQQVEDAFDGNLCRCTGYRRILDAAQQLVAENASLTPEEAVRTAAASAAQHAACDIEEVPHSCGATPLPKKATARNRRNNQCGHGEESKHACNDGDACTQPRATHTCASGGVCADTQPRVPLVAVSHAHTTPPPWYVPSSLAELQPLLADTSARIVAAGTGEGTPPPTAPRDPQPSRRDHAQITHRSRRDHAEITQRAALCHTAHLRPTPSDATQARRIRAFARGCFVCVVALPRPPPTSSKPSVAPCTFPRTGVSKYYAPAGVPVSRGGPLPALPSKFLDVSSVSELVAFNTAAATGALTIGAGTTLKRLYDYAAEQAANSGNQAGERWLCVREHMHKVANHQARARTVGRTCRRRSLHTAHAPGCHGACVRCCTRPSRLISPCHAPPCRCALWAPSAAT
jgi:hypothetical protein